LDLQIDMCDRVETQARSSVSAINLSRPNRSLATKAVYIEKVKAIAAVTQPGAAALAPSNLPNALR
jgi:hypothetical protein